MFLRWLSLLTFFTFFVSCDAFGTGIPARLSAQTVSDRAVDDYIASFKSHRMPSIKPKVNYAAMVKQLGTPSAWFVGQFLPPGGQTEGEINIYPTYTPDRVCMVVKTKRSLGYSDATLTGKVLRTSNPMFTDRSEKYLKYAANDVVVPVVYQHQAYIGWGLYDPSRKNVRFLTLGFSNLPADPAALLTGKTGDAVRAQFQASGCRTVNSPQSAPAETRLPANATAQTINHVTVQIQPATSDQFDRVYHVRVENRSTQPFGFMPNRIVVSDQNRRPVPYNFFTLAYGAVVQPGGSLDGTLCIRFQKSALTLQLPEATTSHRTFTLAISP